MQKDILYIDVEDDITAIISKVKASKEKIVALVPPKRIGVLQSAVNLRLLERAASQSDKKLVLISGNAALSSLAAAAKIPVAKNLQSKPELGEIAALDVDEGNDIIDGSELPIGEHARMAAEVPVTSAAANIIDDDGPKNIEKAPAPAPGEQPGKPKTKKGPKVPNFDKFRKKIVLIGGGVVLLIAFLVWAIFFAPRATVIIEAKTTDASLNDTVTLATNTSTNIEDKTLKSTTQTLKKDVSQTFQATGKKNVGDKATGEVRFTNNSQDSVTIPSGTRLTASGGLVYILDDSVTIDGGSVVCNPFPNCHGATKSSNGTVTAEKPGTNYNAASGNLSGTPSRVAAKFTDPTSGGTDKTVKVVTADDIKTAKQQLMEQDTDQRRSQLAEQFDSDVIILKDTFKASDSDLTSSPAQGKEADSGQAKLSGSISYTMVGVEKSEVSNYLDHYFKDQLSGQKNQRVYDNGLKDVSFKNVSLDGKKVDAQLAANGKIGPSINDDEVKNLAKGKKLGDIQSSLQSIQGVRSVDVKYWPFWVGSTPNDTNRITVQFKLSGK